MYASPSSPFRPIFQGANFNFRLAGHRKWRGKVSGRKIRVIGCWEGGRKWAVRKNKRLFCRYGEGKTLRMLFVCKTGPYRPCEASRSDGICSHQNRQTSNKFSLSSTQQKTQCPPKTPFRKETPNLRLPNESDAIACRGG